MPRPERRNMLPEHIRRNNHLKRESLRTAIFRQLHAGMLMGESPVEFLHAILTEQKKKDEHLASINGNPIIDLDDIQHALLGLEEGHELRICLERLHLFTAFDLSVVQNVIQYDAHMSEKRFPEAIAALAEYYHWKEKQNFKQLLLGDLIYRLWLLERFGAPAYPSVAIGGEEYLQELADGLGVESPSFTLSANLSGVYVPEFARRVIWQGEKTDDVERALEVLVDYYCK